MDTVTLESIPIKGNRQGLFEFAFPSSRCALARFRYKTAALLA